jgi:hypothetical protein
MQSYICKLLVCIRKKEPQFLRKPCEGVKSDIFSLSGFVIFRLTLSNLANMKLTMNGNENISNGSNEEVNKIGSYLKHRYYKKVLAIRVRS